MDPARIPSVDWQKDAGEHGQGEHLKRQPNGKVPALVDGDLTVFESGAILLYVVNKFDKQHKIWRYPSMTCHSDN